MKREYLIQSHPLYDYAYLSSCPPLDLASHCRRNSRISSKPKSRSKTKPKIKTTPTTPKTTIESPKGGMNYMNMSLYVPYDYAYVYRPTPNTPTLLSLRRREIRESLPNQYAKPKPNAKPHPKLKQKPRPTETN